MRARTVKRVLRETIEDRRQMKQLAGILWSWLIRQPRECLKCGKKSELIEDFDAHHILGRRSLLLYDLFAGACLCHACHRYGVHKSRESELLWEVWYQKRNPENYAYLDGLKNQLAVQVSLKFVVNDLLSEVERQGLTEKWVEYCAAHPEARKIIHLLT